jgi:hypothetical protein
LAAKVVAEPWKAATTSVAPSGRAPDDPHALRRSLCRRSGDAHLAFALAAKMGADRVPGREVRLASVPGRFDGTITYHDSCSGLREMGVKHCSRALLAKCLG